MGQKFKALGLMLFGAAFLAVGVFMGRRSVNTLLEAEAMRGWTRAPAAVLACNLESHRGSKGGYTYKTTATYRYAVNGVTNVGRRVSLHSGADNVGSFQQRTYAMLSRCRKNKQTTVCWVNPQRPDDAILFRKPRLELLLMLQLFVLVFGGAGAAIVMAGVWELFRRPDAEPMAGLGQIRMNGANAHRVAGALALAVNGYVAFFLWKAFVVMAPERLPWFIWLLAAAGAAPAVLAGYWIGRIKKYGVSVFEMSPMPGVLGGPVSGTIRIPGRIEADAGVAVKLQCIHQYTTGSGKNQSTHRDVLWEDACRLDGGLSCGSETMLPVRFTVPYSKPATTAAGGRKGYYWRLIASAATPGIDYKAVFDVPVRHTSQSVPDTVPLVVPEREAAREPVEAPINREGLRLTPLSAGGFELAFPAWRPRSVAWPLAGITFGLAVLCAVLWTVLRVPLPLAIFATVFDAVFVLMLVTQCCFSREIAVDLSARTVTLRNRFLAGRPRERHFLFTQISDIRSERAGQSGQTMLYRVVLTIDDGRPVTVGSGLRLWRDAEDVAKLLRAALEPGFVLQGFHV